MIKIENVETAGWEPAIRGMRNPLNSWDKSDSEWKWVEDPSPINPDDPGMTFVIGSNDHDLMMRLRNAGTDHRKFMRMIVCYCDITAPLYWHKEMDTYHMGVEKNSCSTMHKIAEREFTPEDFSREHMLVDAKSQLHETIAWLNEYREIYLTGGMADNYDGTCRVFEPKAKEVWWQMIQLLPSSYNQKRTYMISYEALANMYHARKNHKLDEWREFCRWVETLPYSELITGGGENA